EVSLLDSACLAPGRCFSSIAIVAGMLGCWCQCPRAMTSDLGSSPRIVSDLLVCPVEACYLLFFQVAYPPCLLLFPVRRHSSALGRSHDSSIAWPRRPVDAADRSTP